MSVSKEELTHLREFVIEAFAKLNENENKDKRSEILFFTTVKRMEYLSRDNERFQEYYGSACIHLSIYYEKVRKYNSTFIQETKKLLTDGQIKYAELAYAKEAADTGTDGAIRGACKAVRINMDIGNKYEAAKYLNRYEELFIGLEETRRNKY